jgi:hypothetical protein
MRRNGYGDCGMKPRYKSVEDPLFQAHTWVKWIYFIICTGTKMVDDFINHQFYNNTRPVGVGCRRKFLSNFGSGL